jgi:outer membrane protein
LTDQFASDNFQRGGSVGVQASGPIYQGGRITALQRQALGRVDAARGNLHAVGVQIAQGVGTAWAQVVVSGAARVATEEQIRAARVAFRGVREEATLGARTTLDVLDAEQELLDAQANQIAAAANEITAYYSLLASMGLLTAEALKLQVQTYDPAEYYNLVKSAPIQRSKQGEQLDRVLRSLSKE